MTKGIDLVDVPGHENFKPDVVATASKAKGIIFLVDSRNRQNIYQNALYLYDLFISKSIQSLNIGLLVVANF